MNATTNNPDLASLPADGGRYYWAAALGYWSDGDVSSTQYWVDGRGRVWADEPVIEDNTYRGERCAQRQIR